MGRGLMGLRRFAAEQGSIACPYAGSACTSEHVLSHQCPAALISTAWATSPWLGRMCPSRDLTTGVSPGRPHSASDHVRCAPHLAGMSLDSSSRQMSFSLRTLLGQCMLTPCSLRAYSVNTKHATAPLTAASASLFLPQTLSLRTHNQYVLFLTLMLMSDSY